MTRFYHGKGAQIVFPLVMFAWNWQGQIVLELAARSHLKPVTLKLCGSEFASSAAPVAGARRLRWRASGRDQVCHDALCLTEPPLASRNTSMGEEAAIHTAS